MKKQLIVRFMALLLACCAIHGCGKDKSQGSIFGTVTDFATGEPVSNANVQLRPSGETTLTGSDGMYEFLDVPSGSYSITVSKAEYTDLVDDYVIEVKSGKQTKRDVQIMKRPTSLHIYEPGSQEEISELDFGANEGVTQKTFSIFNGGTQNLNYIITKTVDWISNISQSTGTINTGVTYPIVVTINRELLAEGVNTTTLIITSSTDGAKELVVKARKGGSDSDLVVELPSANLMVQKTDLGVVDWSSASLLCSNSTVAEFNDWRLPTKEELMTLYSNREYIGGFTNETYWSSSVQGGYRYAVNFSNGVLDYEEQQNLFHVRAVRTMNEGSVPTVTTATPTDVTSQSATCGGEVVSDGNETVTRRGVCYKTSQNPTISNQCVESGTGTGPFSCNLTGLSPNTKYYVKAFATNSEGTAYGEQKEFTTAAAAPTTFEYAGTTYYVHPEVGEMTWQSAVDYCNNLTYAGYSDWYLPNKDELNAMYVYRNTIGGFHTVNVYCVYWSSTNSDNNSSYAWSQSFYNGSQETAAKTKYLRVRPIRKDGGGTSLVIPTVTTSTPSSITSSSATCGGNVTSDGGATVTQRGVCYSTSPNPTTSSQTVSGGSGAGSYNCSLSGLSSNTTYYVRAYAINSEGTAYGSVESFTTENGGGNSGQTYTYTFESTWEGWTTIDVDGDGNAWQRFYSDEGNTGHNNSVYLMGSESYINDFGPLTPDNYLVSPQKYTVSNGAKISFYVCAQDADYPAEHYGVAISTASNPTANSFVMVWEETLSAKVKSGDKVRGDREQGIWYLKTIDLSSYAGQSIWIAIRHFNCTDQFVINVDDISIITGNN